MDAWLMGLLSRWTPPSRDARSAVLLPQRQGGGGVQLWMTVKVTSRPQQWRNASDHRGGDHMAGSDRSLRVLCKIGGKHYSFLLQTFLCVWNGSMRTHSMQWLWFIKETHGRSGECPRHFSRRILLKASGRASSLWSPPAATAGCLSSEKEVDM